MRYGLGIGQGTGEYLKLFNELERKKDRACREMVEFLRRKGYKRVKGYGLPIKFEKGRYIAGSLEKDADIWYKGSFERGDSIWWHGSQEVDGVKLYNVTAECLDKFSEIQESIARQQIEEYEKYLIPELVEIYSMAHGQAQVLISLMSIEKIAGYKKELKEVNDIKHDMVISECELYFKAIKLLLLAIKQDVSFRGFQLSYTERGFNSTPCGRQLMDDLLSIYKLETEYLALNENKENTDDTTDGFGV